MITDGIRWHEYEKISKTKQILLHVFIKKKLQLTRWNAPINYAASTPLSAKACSFLTCTQAKDGKNVHPWFSISTS